MNVSHTILLRRSYHMLMMLLSKVFAGHFIVRWSDQYPGLVNGDGIDLHYYERIIFTLIALAKESTLADSPHIAVLQILGHNHPYRSLSPVYLQCYVRCLLDSAAS